MIFWWILRSIILISGGIIGYLIQNNVYGIIIGLVFCSIIIIL
jgi:uncharacterized membrane protein (UPF0136 family)